MLLPMGAAVLVLCRRARRLRHGQVLRRDLPRAAARSRRSLARTTRACSSASGSSGSRSGAVALGLLPTYVIGALRTGGASSSTRRLAAEAAARPGGCSCPCPGRQVSYSADRVLPRLATIVDRDRARCATLLSLIGARRAPWDCGFGELDATHAGHGRGLRSADPPHLRQLSSPSTRELPSPFDRAPRYRVAVGDRIWQGLYLPLGSARAARRGCVRVAAAGTHRDLSALQLRDARRCCWRSCYEDRSRSLTQVLEVDRGPRRGAALPRLGQSMPRVAAEPPRPEHLAALSRHPQALSQGRGHRRERFAALSRRALHRLRRDGGRRRHHSLDGHAVCRFTIAADAIALVGLLATARVFLSLAAMDVGTAFGTLGARREMMVGFLAEPALLMVIFVASMISATTALPAIAENLATQTLGALSEPRLHGRRLHPGAARRERAHSRSTIRRRTSSSR